VRDRAPWEKEIKWDGPPDASLIQTEHGLRSGTKEKAANESHAAQDPGEAAGTLFKSLESKIKAT